MEELKREKQLPNEILLKLFSLCDGVTLARLSAVCRRFHDVATELLKRGFWKEACLKEVDHQIIEELLTNRRIEWADEIERASSMDIERPIRPRHGKLDPFYSPWGEYDPDIGENMRLTFRGIRDPFERHRIVIQAVSDSDSSDNNPVEYYSDELDEEEAVSVYEAINEDSLADEDSVFNITTNEDPASEPFHAILKNDGELVYSFHDNIWYSIYARWYISEKRIQAEPKVHIVIDGMRNNPVNCVEITGDLVILGHRKGLVTITDFTTREVQYIPCYALPITGLVLVNSTHTTKFRYSADNFVNHHHLIFCTQDNAIVSLPIGPPNLNTLAEEQIHRDNYTVKIKGMTAFHDLLAVHCHSVIKIFGLTYKEGLNQYATDLTDLQIGLLLQPMKYIPEFPETIWWSRLWRSRMNMVDLAGCFSCHTVDRDNFEWAWRGIKPDHKIKGNREGCQSGSITHSPIRFSHVHLFRDQISFLSSVDGGLYLSTNNYVIHELHRGYHMVTAVGLHASLLVVGFQNGHVMGFIARDNLSLLEIDFERPDFDRIVNESRGTESITHLKVFSSFVGYTIAAATPTSCTIFQFRHSSALVPDVTECLSISEA